jgi:hypothetical protein
MAAAIPHTPPPQLLHISNYDVSKTVDAVESLYLERSAVGKGDLEDCHMQNSALWIL